MTKERENRDLNAELKITMAMHAFMPQEPAAGDWQRVAEFVEDLGADFVLKIAAENARIDLIKPLVAVYGGNLHQTSSVGSDRHKGKRIQENLLSDVLMHYATSPSANRSNAGIERLNLTVEHLLQNGLSAALNRDGLENAVRDAYVLAYPHKVDDRKSPVFDEWAMRAVSYKPIRGPYGLIKQYQPEAIANLEHGMEVERRRLRLVFRAEAAERREAMGPVSGFFADTWKAVGLAFNRN